MDPMGDSRFKIDCFLSFLSSAKELNAHGFLQKPTVKTISEKSMSYTTMLWSIIYGLQ